MENKAHALAAGVFVIVLGALMAVLALWLMRDNIATSEYEMTTDMVVSGLQREAAVRYKGVSVGRVVDIGLDPGRRGNVLVTLAINSDVPITQSTFGELAYQGVTGLSYIQLGDDGSATEKLPVGPNGVPRIPLKPDALGLLGDRVTEAMTKITQVADNVNLVLNTDNQASIARLLERSAAAAGTADRLLRNIDRTLAAQLDPAKADIPALVTQATATLKAAEQAASDAQHTLRSIDGAVAEARQGWRQMTGEGGTLAQIGDTASVVVRDTLPRVHALADETEHTMRQLDQVAGMLADNPQAVLYGNGPIPPGPGEPGFVAPAAGSSQ